MNFTIYICFVFFERDSNIRSVKKTLYTYSLRPASLYQGGRERERETEMMKFIRGVVKRKGEIESERERQSFR